MTTTTTPNMSLVLPVVSSEPGPDWATEINAAFAIVDAHNHSTTGVRITPAAINIDSDLSFSGNNAISLRSTAFQNQSATLGGINDIKCLYVYANNLYYNNSAGTAVRITNGGALDFSTSGINTYSTRTLAGNYTINSTDVYTIFFVSTVAARNITLPPASAAGLGRFYWVKDSTGSGATNVISIIPNGADLIEGANSTYILKQDRGLWQIVGDGVSKWHVSAVPGTVGTGVLSLNGEINGNTNTSDPLRLGYNTVATTGGTTTLSASQYNKQVINFSGTLASNAVIVLPSTAGYAKLIANNTVPSTMNYRLTVGVSGQASPVLIPANSQAWVYCDGTNVLKCGTFPTRYPVIDAQAQLVYAFDETASPFASTGSNAATLASLGTVTTVRMGVFKNAVNVDGTARNAMQGARTVQPAFPIRLSVWVKPRRLVANNQFIFGKLYQNDNTWASPYVSFACYIDNNQTGNWYAQVTTGSNGAGSLHTTGLIKDPILPGVWNHVGLVYDGAFIYPILNGALCAAATAVTGAIDYNTSNSGNYFLGAVPATTNATNFGECIDADFDDFRVEAGGNVADATEMLRWFREVYRRGIGRMDDITTGAGS